MAQRVETDPRTRLLNAAERVLRQDGLAGLSIRKVTAEAGMNVAAVNYTFGSKDALLRALLRRLLAPVTAERLSRIDALVAEGEASVAKLAWAFLEPLLELYNQLGSLLIELVAKQPPPNEHEHRAGDQWRRVGVAELEPGVERLIDALVTLLPGRSRETLRCRIGLLIGTVTMYATDSITFCHLESERELEELLTFVSAGLAA